MPDSHTSTEAMERSKGNARDSGYVRDPHDWYVEDDHSAAAFFKARPAWRSLPAHDPCCGLGTIPRVAATLGFSVSGADLIDRANGQFIQTDYLADPTIRTAIITNPPYGIAVDIIRHALAHVIPGGYVAALVQNKFLHSQSRRALFQMTECHSIIILSKRPSMPPGVLLIERGESCRKGGFVDYCWAIWLVGKTQPGVNVEWAG